MKLVSNEKWLLHGGKKKIFQAIDLEMILVV